MYDSSENSSENLGAMFVVHNDSVVEQTNRRKSSAWEHFTKLCVDLAQCKYCNKKFRVKHSSTSSLQRHLRNTHTEVYENSMREARNCGTAVMHVENPLSNDSTRSQDLTAAIARMMAVDLQPFSIVDDRGFRSLMNIAEPRYTIPSRTIIPRMYEDLKAQITTKLSTGNSYTFSENLGARFVVHNDSVVEQTNRRKSSAWEHFTKLCADLAQCNYCNKKFGVKHSSTSSLQRHLRNTHTEVYENSMREARNRGTAVMHVESPLSNDSTRSQDLTTAIAQMMAVDLQPFSIVDDRGFRSLMNIAEPRYTIPSRSTFSRTIIPRMYEDLKAQIATKLSTGNNVYAYTVDGWTSRKVMNYLSLTVHYVNTDYELKHYTLNLTNLTKQHTFKHLQNIIVNNLTAWGIDVGKPAFFTSDNGRNIVKAINTFPNWTRVPCFGHCLQLVVHAGLNKFPLFQHIRKKCRNIVTHFSKSTTAREKFSELQKSGNGKSLQLIQEVDTRWNSTYAMFTRFAELRMYIDMALCGECTPENLEDNEWEFLTMLIDILAPIKEATEIMSGESYPTVSWYYPMYVGLKNVLANEENEDELNMEIKTSLRTALQERFESIFRNDIYYHAAMLDPRFKEQILPAEIKLHIFDTFREKVNEINNAMDQPCWKQCTRPRSSGSGEPKSKLSRFFDAALGSVSAPEEQSFDVKRDAEMRIFFSEELLPRSENVMTWWKSNASRFPILSLVAKNILAIPATQCTSERLFSASGNLVVATRTRLLSRNVEQISFLHSNLK